MVGVLEIRRGRHVSLLAVSREYLGQGVARALFQRCLAICADQDPRPECLTVHASRFALGVYRRFGFVEQGEEMVVDGIRFTPMLRKL